MNFINHKLWHGLLLSLCIITGIIPSSVSADEFAPALLQINERDAGWVDVIWKIPVKQNRGLGLTPVLPDFLEPVGTHSGKQVTGAWVEHRTYRTDGQSLTGATLEIDGLDLIPTDALIRITLIDGSQHSTILRSGNTSYTIPERATKIEVAGAYWKMGTIHILEGADHLLFVLALLLIVSGLIPLLKAVTAFTVAHSITLVLATLELVRLPSSPTEAIIALSIVFLACEIIHQRNGVIGLTERWPWLIAFLFGLFHGLGFAGALSEIGVPQHEVPMALLMFNVGVETGQLLFIGAVISLMALFKRLPLRLPKDSWQVVPYSIGSIAAFWTIERVASIFKQTI
jgi:hydrogenase/urease accessory protein HupE